MQLSIFILKLFTGWVLLLMLLFSQPGKAQDNIRLTGYISDAVSGEPLPHAAVGVVNSSYGAYSDEKGEFRIENIPPGNYAIKISLLGYRTLSLVNVEIYEDIPNRLQIQLQPQALPGDSVMVYSSLPRFETGIEGNKFILSEDVLRNYRSLGMAAILQQVPGVQIDSPGNGSGHLIRIHGSHANQVLVLLDGQRLNNPQTGTVDLNDIPMDQIDRIEVIPQANSALFGSHAFAGIVHFITAKYLENSSFGAQSGAGSFNTYQGKINGNLVINPASQLQLSYEQNYSRQNFPYQYQGQTWRRENNWYRNQKAFGKFHFHDSHIDGSLLYHFRQTFRGMPSSFFNEQENYGAMAREFSHSLQLHQNWYLSARNYLEILVAYHRLTQEFHNERDPSPFTRYATSQVNSNLESRITVVAENTSGAEFRSGVQYLKEALRQDNFLASRLSMGQKQRDSYGVFAGGQVPVPVSGFWMDDLSLRGALRYEKYFDQAARWYPFLGITMSPGFLPALVFSGSWAKAVRYPDFNSLFWRGDSRARGNPELAPEQKTGIYLNARFNPKSAYGPGLSMNYFSEEVRDLIFWHRSFNGVWEPRNLHRARKKGVDIQLDQNILPEFLQFKLAYSFVKATNLSNDPNTHLKRIVFIPPHTVNATLWFGYHGLSGQLIYRYVAGRETVPANSRGTALPDYRLWDANISAEVNLFSVRTQLQFTVKNITATDYQLIYGYPMPGRQFLFSVSFNKKIK